MRELNVCEIEEVNGGLNPDALWAGTALTPLGAGILLAASILSSAVAISTQIDVEKRAETP